MRDTQTMKKAMRVTMKRIQTIFVRRKPRTIRDDNSMSRSPDDGNSGNSQIEDGLEVNEDRPDIFSPDSPEPSPEPLEIFLSSDEENGDFFTRLPPDNRQRRVRGAVARSKVSNIVVYGNNGDQEGACGSLVPAVNEHKSSLPSALVPANTNRQFAPYYRLPEKTCQIVALTSCGELEKTCVDLPLELQANITVIKETLLREYPPFYDFCVIASDDDYDEAFQFKQYVSLAFGLAGCTLDDGFVSLGAELFDCYELMMDHSSKVFFFVTENFTSSAFCKRLQSGAVFQSLMSKVKKDREKCVPVFPRGFCRAPLALSGIAGLNPTQREVTRRSLDNTYSPQLRQRRLVWDMENYNRRCLEFQKQVPKCIADYQANSLPIEPPSSTMSVMYLSENDQFGEVEECPSSTETTSHNIPIIQLSECDEHEQSCGQNVCGTTCSHGSPSNICKLPTIEKARVEKLEQDTVNRMENSNSQRRKSSAENSENNKRKTSECSDMSGVEDILKQCPIPDEIKETIKEEIVNNTVSSVNISDCATVHVGPSIQVIINQAPPTDISHLKQYINRKCAPSPGNEMSDHHSDSDS